MRDFWVPGPVSVELLAARLEAIRRQPRAAELDGYGMLRGDLIDQHFAQAEFIRDFIAANLEAPTNV
jgi:hypothetical protein